MHTQTFKSQVRQLVLSQWKQPPSYTRCAQFLLSGTGITNYQLFLLLYL